MLQHAAGIRPDWKKFTSQPDDEWLDNLYQMLKPGLYFCLAQQLGSSNSPKMLLKMVGVLLDNTVSSYPRL